MTTLKRTLIIPITLVATFSLGYAFNTITTTPNPTDMKKVTGIGGIFFKSKDPKQLNDWYLKHLGIDAGAYGATFEWKDAENTTKTGQTQWNTFPENTAYFDPSEKDFMINYRVANLEALVVELQKEGVTILDTIETYDYGKFLHIMDPEGHKIELWEPMD